MHPINSTESTVLYRIDVPNHPLAIATSQYGSILDFPPTNINFRQVEWATTDTEENLGVVESQKAKGWDRLAILCKQSDKNDVLFGISTLGLNVQKL